MPTKNLPGYHVRRKLIAAAGGLFVAALAASQPSQAQIKPDPWPKDPTATPGPGDEVWTCASQAQGTDSPSPHRYTAKADFLRADPVEEHYSGKYKILQNNEDSLIAASTSSTIGPGFGGKDTDKTVRIWEYSILINKRTGDALWKAHPVVPG
jgi:hypothetical protein